MGATESREEGRSRGSEESLEDLVARVYDTELDAVNMPHKVSLIGEELDDKTRPLKDVATDFVVDEFFSISTSLYRFLELTYQTFTDAIDIYRESRGLSSEQVFFTFKGGNILRIVSNEFLSELPEATTRQIEEFYSKFFKRSDNDFSIYLDPRVPDYDEVYRDLGVLSYLLQDRLREEFLRDPEHYFDFPKYSTSYASRILKVWLKKFNEAPGYEDKFRSLSLVTSSTDLTTRFMNDDFGQPEREVAAAEIKTVDEYIKITHNDALDFKTLTQRRVHFNLTRSKVFFDLERRDGSTMRVGGELIDVSIPHRTHTGLADVFDNLHEKMTTYDLKFDGGSFPFTSLTLSYLAHDLETAIFGNVTVPWDDRKYAKRINRLFYLYFIDIFIKVKDSFTRIAVLRDLKDMLLSQMMKVRTLRDATLLETDIARLKSSIKRPLILHSFFHELEALIERLSDEDLEQFREMSSLLITNIDFIIGAIGNVHHYCETDGRATERDIYDAKLKSLV